MSSALDACDETEVENIPSAPDVYLLNSVTVSSAGWDLNLQNKWNSSVSLMGDMKLWRGAAGRHWFVLMGQSGQTG